MDLTRVRVGSKTAKRKRQELVSDDGGLVIDWISNFFALGLVGFYVFRSLHFPFFLCSLCVETVNVVQPHGSETNESMKCQASSPFAWPAKSTWNSISHSKTEIYRVIVKTFEKFLFSLTTSSLTSLQLSFVDGADLLPGISFSLESHFVAKKIFIGIIREMNDSSINKMIFFCFSSIWDDFVVE